MLIVGEILRLLIEELGARQVEVVVVRAMLFDEAFDADQLVEIAVVLEDVVSGQGRADDVELDIVIGAIVADIGKRCLLYTSDAADD